MLLNTPGGTSPLFRTTNLQMARLTEEDIAKGEKTAVEINGDQATLYMTEDFKIEYVHNVTEVRNNPQTGQQETVVIRQESSFWSPFSVLLLVKLWVVCSFVLNTTFLPSILREV